MPCRPCFNNSTCGAACQLQRVCREQGHIRPRTWLYQVVYKRSSILLQDSHCRLSLLAAGHRFWHYPLPQLPPKLQPVDAVLLEDVEGKLGADLQSVCEQLSELLNPEGVCVVVLGAGVASETCVNHYAAVPDASEGPVQHQGSKVLLDDVKKWLHAAGLVFVQQLVVQYERSGTGTLQAHAAVWLQQS